MEGSEAIKLLRLGSLEKREVTAPEAESKGTTPIPLETLVVDQDAARDLLCGICLQILTKPQQCKNGHLFCQTCIQQHIKKHPECPQCRTTLKDTDLSRCLFVERHIRQLKVWCKYHFRREEELVDTARGDTWLEDPEGCTEIAQLEEISKHEAKCGFAFVTCKYSNKCEKFRRKDISAHEKSCAYRPLECSHCKQPVESNKMEEHLLECKMIPVNCEKCNACVQRGDMEHHKKNVCMEELIPCQFADQGCESQVLRKNLKDHLSEQTGEHLLMLKKAFDEQTLALKVNFDGQLKLREDRIKHLERALSEIDTKIEWRVKNWSTVKKKSYIQSEKFHFAEFSWFIGFYTDGDNEESRGYISVYLFLDVASMTKGKNVTIEFLLKFINFKDTNETVRKEFKTTFPIKGGQGWGDRKAIKSARITEESGFLKQDCLYVEAQIILKKVQWVLH